jgi:hypothetical protein
VDPRFRGDDEGWRSIRRDPVQDGNCHQIPAFAGMTIIF